jgi:hypothetical protein
MEVVKRGFEIMPYIKKTERKKFDSSIHIIVNELTNYDKTLPSVGELNYIVSSIIWGLYKKNPSYTLGNNLIGALECIKQEFYRRQLAEYEDKKINENGDI